MLFGSVLRKNKSKIFTGFNAELNCLPVKLKLEAAALTALSYNNITATLNHSFYSTLILMQQIRSYFIHCSSMPVKLHTCTAKIAVPRFSYTIVQSLTIVVHLQL